MRLLFVTWRDLANGQAGGSEELVDHLAKRLTARGHDVAVLAGGPIGPRDYEIVANGGELSQYLRAPFAYARRFRDRDLVVDVANGIPFFVGAWRDKPSICLVHHIHTEQWGQRFSPPMASVGRSLEERAMPRVYRDRPFIAVSPSTSEGLRQLGVAPEQIHLVPNGVELPARPEGESEEPLFLAIGRMVSHKRFERLFDLWPAIHERVGGRLLVAGEGPASDDLRRRPIPEGIELLGRIDADQKDRLLGQAWALVHPAAWEGWGIVIMEAAAHGTPAVGYRVPGVRDAIVDGETGLLADTDEDFVDQWLRVATDATLRAQLGTAARERAQDYSWDATTDKFLEVAEATLASSSIGRSDPPGEPALPQYHVVEQWGSDAEPAELSIVIPAYDEAQRLPFALRRLHEAVVDRDWEVILVDDCSTDQTVSVAADLLAEFPRARVLQLDRHRGKGAAVRAGVAHARGDRILFMDADMATDLGHLPEMVEALDEHDVVIGSRYAPGAVAAGLTPSRDNVSRLFLTMSRNAMGLPLSDFQCGFKGFRAPVARVVFHLLKEQGWAFDVELLALANAAGADIHEMPVRWSSVQGSHIRIVSDSARMVRDLGRIARHFGRSNAVYLLQLQEAALEEPLLATLAKVAPCSVAAALDDDVLVLLPFTDRAAAGSIRREICDALPGVHVRLRLLSVEEFLAPRMHRERQTLLDAEWRQR